MLFPVSLYAPDILKRAGLGSDFASMLGSVGVGMINFICIIIAMLLVDRIEGMAVCLFFSSLSGSVISGSCSLEDIQRYFQERNKEAVRVSETQ